MRRGARPSTTGSYPRAARPDTAASESTSLATATSRWHRSTANKRRLPRTIARLSALAARSLARGIARLPADLVGAGKIASASKSGSITGDDRDAGCRCGRRTRAPDRPSSRRAAGAHRRDCGGPRRGREISVSRIRGSASPDECASSRRWNAGVRSTRMSSAAGAGVTVVGAGAPRSGCGSGGVDAHEESDCCRILADRQSAQVLKANCSYCSEAAAAPRLVDLGQSDNVHPQLQWARAAPAARVTLYIGRPTDSPLFPRDGVAALRLLAG